MKKLIIILIILIIFIVMMILVFSNKKGKRNDDNSEVELKMRYGIKINVNNEDLIVELEDNVATQKLVARLKEEPITIKAREYGDFEKVGSLGFSLPTANKQLEAEAGDVMLYQGNQITLFYGHNSWSYTKIGHINNKSAEELKDILGNGDVTLILSLVTY